MGIKPKTSFRHFIPTRCSRWLAVLATHIPRRPKKKPLRGKKVGFAEKKTAPAAKNGASCVSRVGCPYLWILATTDPPRLFALGFAISKLRFRLRLSLAWSCPQYAISDGELEIAKGRLFCNQIPHNPFITKILIRFFATKNFKEKTFPNHPSTP